MDIQIWFCFLTIVIGFKFKIKVNFIYIAHLKTTTVDQSAFQAQNTQPNIQNKDKSRGQNSDQIESQGRWDFNKNLNISAVRAALIWIGRIFQRFGAATEKAQPLFCNLDLGIDDLSAFTGECDMSKI